MSYPTSVFNPAVRTNGQSIDASHVNDLQTEVTAIETALLGTITHSLNVSGASTLASLQVGASTFSVRPVEPPPHAARVKLDDVLNLTNNTTQAVSWTGQVFAINSSIHSTGTNPERLTPQSTGVYAVIANAQFGDVFGASTGSARMRILDSSGTDIARVTEGGLGGFAPNLCLMGIKRFDSLGATPWVRVEIVVRDASTHSVSTLSGASMHKL